MPDPIQSPDRISVVIDALRKQGASEHDIETYLTEHEGLKPVEATPTGHLGKPFVDAPAETAPGIGTKTLGVLAALNRDIPGMEAAQAGARSLVRGEPYSQARDEIRGAEDAAPTSARVAARVLGGGLAAVALPGIAAKVASKAPAALGLGRAAEAGAAALKGSGAIQGGTFGGLAGLGSSEQMSLGDRAGKTLVGAGIGTLAGGASDRALAILRAKGAPLGDEADAVAGQVKDASSRVIGAIRGGRRIPATVPTSIDDQMGGLLTRLRAEQPNEIGATYGDAEEAMGLAPHQQPDLEEQLRQSIIAKGGQPAAAPQPVNGRDLDPDIFAQGRANLRRANAGDERDVLLSSIGSLPRSGGKLVRVARALTMSDAGEVVPRLSTLDQELGTQAPAVFRALGITALTPTSR